MKFSNSGDKTFQTDYNGIKISRKFEGIFERESPPVFERNVPLPQHDTEKILIHCILLSSYVGLL